MIESIVFISIICDVSECQSCDPDPPNYHRYSWVYSNSGRCSFLPSRVRIFVDRDRPCTFSPDKSTHDEVSIQLLSTEWSNDHNHYCVSFTDLLLDSMEERLNWMEMDHRSDSHFSWDCHHQIQ